jgi:DeoR family fructose operon transcriptional repressor
MGQIKLDDICMECGISLSTLHRDLQQMEERGLIEKVRGGAVLTHTSHLQSHFDIRMQHQIAEKHSLTMLASSRIKDDTCVFLDHSTTAVYLARAIKERPFRNLVVLTNSLAVPFELMNKTGVEVIVTGGTVEKEFKALSGPRVLSSLESLNLHQVFASVGALSIEQGLMTSAAFIHALFSELFHCGSEINIIADSSKFFKIATFKIGPLEMVGRIFTDSGIPEDLRNEISVRGIEIVV